MSTPTTRTRPSSHCLPGGWAVPSLWTAKSSPYIVEQCTTGSQQRSHAWPAWPPRSARHAPSQASLPILLRRRQLALRWVHQGVGVGNCSHYDRYCTVKHHHRVHCLTHEVGSPVHHRGPFNTRSTFCVLATCT